MSFGTIAAEYDRLRSGPPEAAIDWLLPAAPKVAVDLGAGTGLLSRALARRVPRVIAVEPDDRMAAVLRTRDPVIEVRQGRGEAIPLPDASADAVFISSAWHWMEPAKAAAEVARVLRDGGRFAVIWTGRDRESDWLRPELWFAESGVDRDRNWARSNIGQRESELPHGGEFTNIETRTFLFNQSMTPSDLVEMLATHSRIITSAAADQDLGRARAIAAIRARFPAADVIDVPMRARCWRADRIAR